MRRERSDEPPGERDVELERPARPDRVWVCAACGTAVTTPSAAIQVEGRHRHYGVNPAGHGFAIGCFSRADGDAVGPSVLEDTWFEGYAWTIFVCARCRRHLGWRYDGPTRFFGLIFAHLAERE
ncbi:MAG: cereblon family protein [Myxococcota bacterium]